VSQAYESLIEYIKDGKTEEVRKILTENLTTPTFDVNSRWPNEPTPLGLACSRGHIDIIKALVEHKADVNKKNHNQLTSLHICIQTQPNAPEAMAYLLSQNADPNLQEMNGWSPLCLAAFSGHVPIIQSLLHSKADHNKTTSSGASAVWLAAEQNHAGAVRTLAAAKADLSIVDKEGVSPLWKASESIETKMEKRTIETVKFLIAAGANLIPSNDKFSPAVNQILLATSANPAVVITELLLEEAEKLLHLLKDETPSLKYLERRLFLKNRLIEMEGPLEEQKIHVSAEDADQLQKLQGLITGVKNIKFELVPSLVIQASAYLFAHGESSAASEESASLSSSSCTLLASPSAETAAQLSSSTTTPQEEQNQKSLLAP
jgi:ankyrin repeat protein